ncbi:MAG: hypothetical protein WC716_14540 [Chitinophagaceae bacterium]|jgi:hypothetical protein
MENIPNEFLKPAAIIAALPQYAYSEAMYERFLDAIHYEGAEIKRAINEYGVKILDKEEIELDNFEYFFENETSLKDIFYEELCNTITEEKAELFCRTLCENWSDGRSTRLKSSPMLNLMSSIDDYFIEYRKGKIKVQNSLGDKKIVKATFTADDIHEILTLNKQMLVYDHLDKWITGHDKNLEISSQDIYCRRGLYLEKHFDSKEYLEYNLINSYSLAFTITERFSQIEPNKISVILNTSITNLIDRILFFSPFIKGMSSQQLELGIIPSHLSQQIKFQGDFSGICEYEIDRIVGF